MKKLTLFTCISTVFLSIIIVLSCGDIQIGSEQPTSVRDLAETVVKISEKNIKIYFDESKPEGDRGRIGICERARNILGWKPQVSLDEGLARTYAWIYNDIMTKN